MAWSWRDVPRLLRSPNRWEAIGQAYHAWAWQPLYPAVWLYRRTAAASCPVVAVTGTYGKTTTTQALEAILGLPSRHVLNDNFGMHLVHNLVSMASGGGPAVLEVGISRKGQMARYAAMLRPDITVVTAVGSEHHPALGGIDGVQREKSLLVRALPPSGLAVLNGDDPRVRAMAEMTRAQVLFYGLGPNNQVRAKEVSLDWPRGLSFTLEAPGVEERVELKLLGEHFVLGALAASAVGLRLGLSPAQIKAGLARLTPSRRRLFPVSLGRDIWLLEDDYKNIFESVYAALDLIAQVPAKRRIVVLGTLNYPLGSLHPMLNQLGCRLGQVADLVIFIGSQAKSLFAGLRKGGMAKDGFIDCHHDVHAAARELRRRLEPGDLVLLKGRSNQQFRRVSLLLQGREVSCAVQRCDWSQKFCDDCVLLNRPPRQAAGTRPTARVS